MSVLSNDLSIYLKGQFNCDYINNIIVEDVDYLYNKLINHEYFPIDFDKLLQQFPIFPNGYKGIFKLYNINPSTNEYDYQFNIVKIRNNMIVDNIALKNNINDNLLFLKTQLDKYSNNPEELIFNIKYQKLYFDFDYIDSSKVWLHQKYIANSNYFYNVLGSEPSLNCNIIENIILMNLMNSIFFYNNTFSTDFNSYFLVNSTADLVSDFTNFINTYDTELSNYLAKFISNYIFKMLKPADAIITKIQNYIKDDILPKLITTFTNFAAEHADGKQIISTTILSYLQNYLSYFMYVDLTINNTQFINDYEISRANVNYIFNDDEVFTTYKDNIQKYNIQRYLNLSYVYKDFPLTYLNILSKIMASFIDDSILPDSEMNLIVQQNFINSDISRIIDNLISMGFHTYIQEYIDTDKILSFYNDNNIGNLIIFYFVKDIIEEFIESLHFNDFIITDFLENISQFLKDDMLLPKDFNWFQNINLIKWTFKLFFDKHALNVFETFKTDIDQTMTEILEVKSQIIGEILIHSPESGINYFNTVYKIDTLKVYNVYVNGILIDPSQYIIMNTLIIFDFNPLSTDVVQIDYYPYYIEFRYNQSSIDFVLAGVSSNKTNQEYISQMLKNIFKGSVTKSIFNDILAYYLV